MLKLIRDNTKRRIYVNTFEEKFNSISNDKKSDFISNEDSTNHNYLGWRKMEKNTINDYSTNINTNNLNDPNLVVNIKNEEDVINNEETKNLNFLKKFNSNPIPNKNSQNYNKNKKRKSNKNDKCYYNEKADDFINDLVNEYNYGQSECKDKSDNQFENINRNKKRNSNIKKNNDNMSQYSKGNKNSNYDAFQSNQTFASPPENQNYEEFYEGNSLENNFLARFNSKGSTVSNTNNGDFDFLAKFNTKGSTVSNSQYQDDNLANFSSKGDKINTNNNNQNNKNKYKNKKNFNKNFSSKDNTNNNYIYEQDDFLAKFNSRGSTNPNNFAQSDFLNKFNSKGSEAENNYFDNQDDFLANFNSRGSTNSNNLNFNSNANYDKNEKNYYNNINNKKSNYNKNPKELNNQVSQPIVLEKTNLSLKELLGSSSRKIVFLEKEKDVKQKSTASIEPNKNSAKTNIYNDSINNNTNIDLNIFNSNSRVVTIQKKNSTNIIRLQNNQFNESEPVKIIDPNVNQKEKEIVMIKLDAILNKSDINNIMIKEKNDDFDTRSNLSKTSKVSELSKNNEKLAKREKKFCINNYDYDTNSKVTKKENEEYSIIKNEKIDDKNKNYNNNINKALNKHDLSIIENDEYLENATKNSKRGKFLKSNFEEINEVNYGEETPNDDVDFDYLKNFNSMNNRQIHTNQIKNKNIDLKNFDSNTKKSRKNENNSNKNIPNQNKNSKNQINKIKKPNNRSKADEIFNKILNSDKISATSEKTTKTSINYKFNNDKNLCSENDNKEFITADKNNINIFDEKFVQYSHPNEHIASYFNNNFNIDSKTKSGILNSDDKSSNKCEYSKVNIYVEEYQNEINSNKIQNDKSFLNNNPSALNFSVNANKKQLKIDLKQISSYENNLNENIDRSKFLNEIDLLKANLTPNKRNLMNKSHSPFDKDKNIKKNFVVNLKNKFLENENNNMNLNSKNTYNNHFEYDKINRVFYNINELSNSDLMKKSCNIHIATNTNSLLSSKNNKEANAIEDLNQISCIDTNNNFEIYSNDHSSEFIKNSKIIDGRYFNNNSIYK